MPAKISKTPVAICRHNLEEKKGRAIPPKDQFSSNYHVFTLLYHANP